MSISRFVNCRSVVKNRPAQSAPFRALYSTNNRVLPSELRASYERSEVAASSSKGKRSEVNHKGGFGEEGLGLTARRQATAGNWQRTDERTNAERLAGGEEDKDQLSVRAASLFIYSRWLMTERD